MGGEDLDDQVLQDLTAITVATTLFITPDSWEGSRPRRAVAMLTPSDSSDL